jgi:putative membrane protein
MVKDHEKDIELFKQQAESGQDPDLRAFPEESLPTLREHLELAKEVQSEVTAAPGNAPEQKHAAKLGAPDRTG